MVRLPCNKKQTYHLNFMPQMWPLGLTLAMTLTFNIQGQIWNWLHLNQKWSNCHETKNERQGEDLLNSEQGTSDVGVPSTRLVLYDEFMNYTYKITATSPRGQWVNIIRSPSCCTESVKNPVTTEGCDKLLGSHWFFWLKSHLRPNLIITMNTVNGDATQSVTASRLTHWPLGDFSKILEK